LPRIIRNEEYEGFALSCEGVGSNMRVFRGFAIILTVALISLGIFILYDPLARRNAAASDGVIPGAVLFTFALALLYFLSRPTVK
jgi:hypothetical protein